MRRARSMRSLAGASAGARRHDGHAIRHGLAGRQRDVRRGLGADDRGGVDTLGLEQRELDEAGEVRAIEIAERVRGQRERRARDARLGPRQRRHVGRLDRQRSGSGGGRGDRRRRPVRRHHADQCQPRSVPPHGLRSANGRHVGRRRGRRWRGWRWRRGHHGSRGGRRRPDDRQRSDCGGGAGVGAGGVGGVGGLSEAARRAVRRV